MILLLALGIAVGAMGLLALGFGIPIKETTFGNSLMLGGATAIGSGLILIGLALVVRELKALTAAIGQSGGAPAPRVPAASTTPTLPPLFPKAPAAADEDYDASQFQPPPAPQATPQPTPQPTPPWATEAAARGRPPVAPAAESPVDLAPEPVPGEPPPLAPLVMPPRPKRNLLFPSRRKDTPPAAEAAAPVLPEMPAAPPRAPVIPPVQTQEPRQEPRHEPRMTFNSAWPANGPGTAPQVQPQVPPQVQPPAPPPPAPHPPEGVTVIKSGTVDGMAYTLYSDGSIEAQMSEGMLRFASLEELRTYLAERP